MEEVTDARPQPRIQTRVVVRALMALFLTRLGSLNALRDVSGCRFWRTWLKAHLPSADTLGRVAAGLNTERLRFALHHVYDRLKRNKALPLNLGRAVAVIDGHESFCSYDRHCSRCLERIVHTASGDRLQYYHRYVALMLLPGPLGGGHPLRLLLDLEMQLPGEDEVATARRLLERVLKSYPRAFDLLLADALYAVAPFINFLVAHRKHALIVLKDDRRHLYQDVARRFETVPPQAGRRGHRRCLWWDFKDLGSWPEVGVPLRVVRSLETFRVRRQRDHQTETRTSDWIWVTTLDALDATTERVVAWGHQRWDVENHGYNDLVHGWHADHVYKHDPTALEVCLLLTLLAFNLFFAFFLRNLKLRFKRRRSVAYWARQVANTLLVAPNSS